MAHLQPQALVLYETSDGAFGFMAQPDVPQTDLFSTIAAMAQQGDMTFDGIHTEMNTGNFSLEPVTVPEDLPLASLTTTAGLFKEVVNRATGKKGFSQRDCTADTVWSAETSNTLLEENEPFSIHLKVGPCPKDGDHSPDGYYRRVTWPANSPDGQNRYRFVLTYSEAPYLEVSQDAGSLTPTWKRLGAIPCPIDLNRLRRGENIEISLTVWPMEQAVVVWLGQDLNRFTFQVQGDAVGYAGGPILFEGKNGFLTADFSRFYFKVNGSFVSYARSGPERMDARPGSEFNASALEDGQTLALTVVDVDRRNRRYRYRVDMAGVPISDVEGDPLAAYTKHTPLLKDVTILWPGVWTPPPRGGWREAEGLLKIRDVQSFGVSNRQVRKRFTVAVSNRFAQYRRGMGIRAMRIALGYAHTGLFVRGDVYGNTRGSFEADGAVSYYSFEGDDLFYPMDGNGRRPQPVTQDLQPGGWCVYAAARLLLQMGRLVPELFYRLPTCPYGRNPGCNHTKMPPEHGGWRAVNGATVLGCLEEVQGILFAWMGPGPMSRYEATLGHPDTTFRFEPFEPAAPYRVEAQFREAPTGDGSSLDEALSAGVGVQRNISLDDVVNDYTYAGFSRDEGRPFAVHAQDFQSLHNPASPNYKPFVSPYAFLWSGLNSEAYAREVLARESYWLSLPAETSAVVANGQPWLFPLNVYGLTERRIIGYAEYFITSIQSDYETGGDFTSRIAGQWTGRFPVPGYEG